MADNLKKSGKYKVGLLSNISRDWMSEILEYFDSREIFDEMILSGDINIVKPDPQIFKLMAEKLNLDPAECVMIDDLASNVNGARIAGMHGVVFFTTQQAIEDLDNILELENA
jgi:epoxide hydrolase-like predicted phosphatase